MTPGVEGIFFSCDMVEWEKATGLSRILAYKIHDSGFFPDIVIAIGRGGYVPARVVCDYLLHEKLTSIKIEHWGIAGEKKEETKIVFPLSVNIDGQSVLIVDDVTDTGDTLEAAVRYISSLNPSEIKTGVLQHKKGSSFSPDFYAEYVDRWRWIVYPWARHEELFGFSEKVLSGEPVSAEEITRILREKYEITAPESEVEDALSHLVKRGLAVRKGDFYTKKKREF